MLCVFAVLYFRVWSIVSSLYLKKWFQFCLFIYFIESWFQWEGFLKHTFNHSVIHFTHSTVLFFFSNFSGTAVRNKQFLLEKKQFRFYYEKVCNSLNIQSCAKAWYICNIFYASTHDLLHCTNFWDPYVPSQYALKTLDHPKVMLLHTYM